MNGSVVERAKSRLLLIVIIGSISLALLFFFSLAIGAYGMSFETAISSFFNLIANFGVPQNMDENIIMNSRLPRTLSVIGVGIGLSIAGAVMQAIIRNPLVDPYITGVASGAALGASLVVMGGVTIAGMGLYSMPLAAFAGAIIAFGLTMALSEAAGGKPISFVLAGVMIGLGFSSITNILSVLNPDEHKGIMFWMFGSFQAVNLDQTMIILVPTL
ncbi:MAG TPA: iron chelate uptake ABC transporter family permease subunit, partial [Methanomassiliicoccales archaeon]|nr:iron chelate uptake ABC transporter family permease subunit [Methanomassiliicoccales archaeon]